MKYFIYFESTEGGMEVNYYAFKDDDINFRLFGWMSDCYGCKEDDEKLINWAIKSKVGDYFNHRIGTCVRVNNIKK